VALALHEVGPIYRACGYVDKHFACAWLRIRNLPHLEHVGRPGMGDHSGTHAVNPRG